MKKILATLLSLAMLLALASCGKEDTPATSDPASAPTSETSSETPSEELPADKLTDNEIQKILAEIKAISAAKSLSVKMDTTEETAVMGMSMEVSIAMENVYNGKESYSKATTDMGKGPSTQTTYFKDGKAYVITSGDDGIEGYYYDATYEEVAGEATGEDDLGITEDMLKNVDIKREEGKITITSREGDENVKAWLADFNAGEETEEEPTEETEAPAVERAVFSLTVDENYKILSLTLGFTSVSEEEGEASMDMTMTFSYYGDDEIEVPVPEGLDVCVSEEEYNAGQEIDWDFEE